MLQLDTPKALRRLAGAALVAALAAPSAAAADASVVGGPLKVRDYEMTLVGSDDGAKDSLTVMFNRVAGDANQMHMYSFASGVTVTPTSIKGSLGRYGAVRLKLTGARSGKGVVPKGCTGNPGTTKSGTLTGSFKLVADTTYFKTVTAKALKGSSSTGGTLTCASSGGGGGAGAGGPQLSLYATDGTAMTTFTASRQAQSAMRMDDAAATAPATIMHSISAEGSGFDPAADLGTATVTGASPFLKGTGSYEGTTFPGGSSGTLDGSLVAAFDSIGHVTLRGDASIR